MPTEKEKVCWYKDGKLHREDGPAIEWSFGTKEWWVAGKRHRLDGPAVEAEKVGYMWFKGGYKTRLFAAIALTIIPPGILAAPFYYKRAFKIKNAIQEVGEFEPLEKNFVSTAKKKKF
jgi:hypothetical protein